MIQCPDITYPAYMELFHTIHLIKITKQVRGIKNSDLLSKAGKNIQKRKTFPMVNMILGFHFLIIKRILISIRNTIGNFQKVNSESEFLSFCENEIFLEIVPKNQLEIILKLLKSNLENHQYQLLCILFIKAFPSNSAHLSISKELILATCNLKTENLQRHCSKSYRFHEKIRVFGEKNFELKKWKIFN